MAEKRMTQNSPHWQWQIESIATKASSEVKVVADQGFGENEAWHRKLYHHQINEFTQSFHESIAFFEQSLRCWVYRS